MNEPGCSCSAASVPHADACTSSPRSEESADSASSQGGTETAAHEYTGDICEDCNGIGHVASYAGVLTCTICYGSGRHPTWRDLYDREMATAAKLRAELSRERESRQRDRRDLTAERDAAVREIREAQVRAAEARNLARAEIDGDLAQRDRWHAEDMDHLLTLLDANLPCDQSRHDQMREDELAWFALRLVGVQVDPDGSEWDLELRNCPACGSTLSLLRSVADKARAWNAQRRGKVQP